MSQQITTPTLPTAAAPSPRKSSSAWPVAVTLIVIALVIGLPLGITFLMWNHAVINAPARLGNAMQNFATDILRPRTTINEIVFASIQDMQRQQKLVVLETTVDADVTREEGSSSWGMYWGTNIARVAVKDAHVQYYIDLTKLGTADFIYNDPAKTLTIALPAPKLDTAMVSIDPAKIQTLDLRGGWMLWNKQETRDNAIGELRPKIIIQANTPFMQREARNAGQEAMIRFMTPLMTNLSKEGVKLNVTYR